MKKINRELIVEYLGDTPRRPIATIVGLPGLGLVGAGACSMMLSNSKCKPITVARIVCTKMLSRLYVGEDGLAPSYDFQVEYIEIEHDSKNSGILLLVGRSQPPSGPSQFALAEFTLGISKQNGIQWIMTVGGYQVPNLSENRSVYVSSNDLLTMKIGAQLGFKQLTGQVTGAAGLVAGLSKYMGFHGGCLLAETDGKAPDVKASESAYSALGKLVSRIGSLVLP